MATKAHWLTASDDFFNDPASWSTGLVPDQNTDAFLDAVGNNYSVVSNASETVDYLDLSANATMYIRNSEFDVSGTEEIDNAGKIVVGLGSTLKVGNGGSSTLYNSGVFTIAGALQFNVGAGSFSGFESEGGVVGGVIRISDTTSISSVNAGANVLNYDNKIVGSGSIGIGDNNMNFANLNDGKIISNGATALTLNTGTNSVFNYGVMRSLGTGGITVDSNFVNFDMVAALSGVVTFDGSVTNRGVIEADNGSVIFNGALPDGGKAVIGGTGSIEYGAKVATPSDVDFLSGAQGTLKLDGSQISTTGDIWDFTSSDHIDLAGIAYVASGSGATTLGGNSTVAQTFLEVNSGSGFADIGSIVGQYVFSQFQLSSDLHGGTLISYKA